MDNQSLNNCSTLKGCFSFTSVNVEFRTRKEYSEDNFLSYKYKLLILPAKKVNDQPRSSFENDQPRFFH